MRQLTKGQKQQIVTSLNAGKLLPDHYIVQIVSSQLPPFTTLEKMFRRGGVTSHFNGQPWKRHVTRLEQNISDADGLRFYWVANPPPHIARRRQPIIDWAESMGYQVAVETEAVDFARAFPNVQRKHFIVAFGSSARSKACPKRCVAMLSSCKLGIELVGTPADVDLPDFCRVLLVKK